MQGVFNFCNPGPISHNEILDLYKQYIDPTFVYANFTVEEQDKILVAKRSNNTLVSTVCFLKRKGKVGRRVASKER